MFPPWALALITNFPDSFTNMANCWAAIIAEASSQAACRKMGAGGRVLQLAADTMPEGELDGINDVTGSMTILQTEARNSVVAQSFHFVRAADDVEILVICAATAHSRLPKPRRTVYR